VADKLVTIAVYGNTEDAYFAKMTLAENNINSVVLGDSLLMATPRFGLPKVELKVLDRYAEQARKILASEEKQER